MTLDNEGRRNVLRIARIILSCCLLVAFGGCELNLDDLPNTPGEQVPTDTSGDGSSVEEDGASTSAVDVFNPITACGGLPTCRRQGICADLPEPECIDDGDGGFVWDCKYTDEQIPSDELCDGEDNDCDGVIDNVPDLPLGQTEVDCGQGVCAGARARCVVGTWQCDFSQTADWQGGQETLCDAQDNDCDGEIDEGITADPADPSVCGWQGVCANAPLVECNSNVVGQASWNCSDEKKGEAIGFSIIEQCDGLDNNCNGDIDEAVPANPAACKTDGVCNTTTPLAACTDGSWTCDYSPLGAAYQDIEASCDGLDNDCDGLTDEGQLSLSQTDCSDPKLGVGVCGSTGVIPICINGTVACIFDAVIGFETDESICDGVDNDCDGQTDESDTVLPPVGQCTNIGACSTGLSAVCGTNGWECNYANSQYEAGSETSCDNIDNDCDGLTDENIVLDVEQCAKPGTTQLEGVCVGQPITAACVGGAPVCNYGSVAAYQDEETLCDNLDNDCDGVTDEGLENLEDFPIGACQTAGVCSQGVLASCNAGTWICDYNLVVGYESGDETSCDLKDNDCDGFIDENITTNDSDVCNAGVCATGGAALCMEGEYRCDVANVIGFENPEVSCDGLDNDCDGSTDIGTCPLLTQCIASSSCQEGLQCSETPDDDAPSCCVEAGYCPLADCTGQVSAGTSICSSGIEENVEVVQVVECLQTGWSDTPVTCSTGACVDGECAECAPNSALCSDGLQIITCDGEGTIQGTEACSGGTTCAPGYPGVCMTHADQQADTSSDSYFARRPAIIATGVSATLLGYEQEDVDGESDGWLRSLDGGLDNSLFGNAGPIQSLTQISTTSARDIALGRINGQYALGVWSQGNNQDEGEIKARIFDYTGSTVSGVGSPLTVNTADPLVQRYPAIAMFGSNNALATWESLSNGISGEGLDIRVRRLTIQFGTTLNTAGVETIANTTIANEQREPQITRVGATTALIAWTSEDQDFVGTSGLYGRIYSLNTGSFTTLETRLNDTVAGNQAQLAVARRSNGGIVGIWQSDHQGDGDIFIRTFNSALVGTNPEVCITANEFGGGAAGIQRHPDVVVTNDGSIVAAWDDASGEANGGAVFLQQFRDDLTPVGNARLVNGPNAVTGDQLRPALAPARDLGNQRFWVVVAFEHGNANGIGVPGVFVKPMVLAP